MNESKTYNFTFEISSNLPLSETQKQIIRAGFGKVLSQYILRHKASINVIIGDIKELINVNAEQVV